MRDIFGLWRKEYDNLKGLERISHLKHWFLIWQMINRAIGTFVFTVKVNNGRQGKIDLTKAAVLPFDLEQVIGQVD